MGGMTGAAGRLRVGPGSGQLRIRTRREGFAAKVGHDLTIEVTRWSAEIEPGGDDLGDSRLCGTIELDSLEAREGTGGAMPLTDKDRAEINDNIRRTLGRSTATFTSTRVIPEGDGGGTIEGTLSLNGISKPVRLTVHGGDGVHYRGGTTIAQTDFGVKPYTAFLGALRLRDEVEFEFEVNLDAAERVESG